MSETWTLDVDDTFDLAAGPSSRWCSLRRGGRFLSVSVEGPASEWLEMADAIAARRPLAFKRAAFTPTAAGGDFHSPRNAFGEQPSASLTADELAGLVVSIREQLAPAASAPTAAPVGPPAHIIDAARLAGALSPCRKSKRGAAIYNPATGMLTASACNRLPAGECTGDAACRAACGRRCIHAEAGAIVDADRECLEGKGREIVHVKVIDGAVVASGPPSCVPCASLILGSGLAAAWLLHEDGWRRYPADEFYRLSCAAPVKPAVDLRVADVRRISEGAVATFIDVHARRLADQVGGDNEPQDVEHFAAQVHDVINHLRAVGDGGVIDGRPGVGDAAWGAAVGCFTIEGARKIRQADESLRQQLAEVLGCATVDNDALIGAVVDVVSNRRWLLDEHVPALESQVANLTRQHCAALVEVDNWRREAKRVHGEAAQPGDALARDADAIVRVLLPGFRAALRAALDHAEPGATAGPLVADAGEAPPTFYIASSGERLADVVALTADLIRRGMRPAFNWPEHWNHKCGPDTCGIRDRPDLCAREIEAARTCDLFVGIERLGKGSHVELGVALTGRASRLILVGVDTADLVFYEDPRIEHAAAVTDVARMLDGAIAADALPAPAARDGAEAGAAVAS